MTENAFGKFFAEIRRKRLEISLREFCERHGFDPVRRVLGALLRGEAVVSGSA